MVIKELDPSKVDPKKVKLALKARGYNVFSPSRRNDRLRFIYQRLGHIYFLLGEDKIVEAYFLLVRCRNNLDFIIRELSIAIAKTAYHEELGEVEFKEKER